MVDNGCDRSSGKGKIFRDGGLLSGQFTLVGSAAEETGDADIDTAADCCCLHVRSTQTPQLHQADEAVQAAAHGAFMATAEPDGELDQTPRMVSTRSEGPRLRNTR